MQANPSADNVTVVIPAYNEAATIADVAGRARAQVARVIVVDDASADNTASCLDGLDVTVLSNEENQGKAGTLWRGIHYALQTSSQAVITLDGDGQHRPEDIPALLEKAVEYPDQIIIASRDMAHEHVPRHRRNANRVANFWIAWACGYPITDSQSGFRLYPASLLKAIDLDVSRDRGFVFESEILIEAASRGIKSQSVPIEAIYADDRRPSHFRPVTDIVRITRMVAWRLIRQGMAPMGLLRSLGIMPQKVWKEPVDHQ
jgi:glycosyltransferase involved in cell wall biosynthesis